MMSLRIRYDREQNSHAVSGRFTAEELPVVSANGQSLLEVSARVSPARDFKDESVALMNHGIVAAVGIGVQKPRPSGQH